MNQLTTDHHDINELLLACENVALLLNACANCFGNEPNTSDQAQLHGQVLKKIKKYKKIKKEERHNCLSTGDTQLRRTR